MLKKMASCIGEYKTHAILSPVYIAFEVLLEVMIPSAMALLIDEGVSKGDLNYTIKIGLLMLAMALVALFFGVMSGRSCAIAGVGFAKNLRRKLFYSVQNYSFSNIDKFSAPSLITRMTGDVTNVQNAFQMAIRTLVRAPLMLICSTTLAAQINRRLAMIFLCLLPLLAIVLLGILRICYPIFKQVFKKYDKLNETTQENLTNIRTVKSYVREGCEIDKMNAASTAVCNMSLKAEKIIVFAQPIFTATIYVAMLLISWIGGKQIIAGDMTTGNFMSFFGYVMQIFMSFLMVGFTLSQIIMSRAAGERIIEVIDEVSDIQNAEDAITVVDDSTVEFKDVCFSYSGDKSKPVLNHINLMFKPGETVGIIGGTGSAKSTLVQLIPRLYDATEGEITVGGVNVKNYDIETLRDSIAMVLQKNVLFSGTIRDNLKWGDGDATEEELLRATKNAAAHSFIESFEGGYETELGQAGVNVSGGQKQRLCIARALLKKPKILILDDSTSAVDVKTNAEIMHAFKEDYPETTKIIIAQRLASVADADKIVVMHDGEINAVGTHDELYGKNEIYTDVYDAQMKGVAL